MDVRKRMNERKSKIIVIITIKRKEIGERKEYREKRKRRKY